MVTHSGSVTLKDLYSQRLTFKKYENVIKTENKLDPALLPITHYHIYLIK
jgi:hypothetical protein